MIVRVLSAFGITHLMITTSRTAVAAAALAAGVLAACGRGGSSSPSSQASSPTTQSSPSPTPQKQVTPNPIPAGTEGKQHAVFIPDGATITVADRTIFHGVYTVVGADAASATVAQGGWTMTGGTNLFAGTLPIDTTASGVRSYSNVSAS
jgi:glucose/arabinose dehydrogenase